MFPWDSKLKVSEILTIQRHVKTTGKSIKHNISGSKTTLGGKTISHITSFNLGKNRLNPRIITTKNSLAIKRNLIKKGNKRLFKPLQGMIIIQMFSIDIRNDSNRGGKP